MTADSVATVVFGNLSRSNQQDSKKSNINILHAFWAPFLLLHLGGPDTITAYSLEDNELWLRHFLWLRVQVGLAFYIFVRSWSNTALTYITIPIFVTGIIKYGERTFVLRSSSSQYFKDLLLSDPDPGPDFIKIKQESRRRPGGPSFLGYCCDQYIETYSDIDEFQNKPSTMVPTASTLPLESLEASTSSSSSAVLPTEISKRRHATQQHQPENLKQANVLPPETLKTGANNLQ
ncbi:hypothetical protein Dsin_024086 [Dipteronia sinensis]|uniref:DUF4220 domain-containing protein n=1 Tax=Dipteronia sinensis TaxID=43782 RepID=A0AAE0A606_9ROSI|nr:hypothetical protein Dsin_024086 [Dipteronia sinensis]